MQPVREVAQLGEAGRSSASTSAISPRASSREVAVSPQPHLQLQGDGDEALLCPVVEIALDLPARAVGGLEDARARRAHLGELRLDDLALAQRLLGAPGAVMSKIAPSSQRRPSPASCA